MKLQIDDLGNVGITVVDWDASKAYKGRVITTDYNSWIAYISRKEVPAGVELTDNEYWKPLMRVPSELAFNYNEFKEEMLKRFDSLYHVVQSFLESSGGTSLDNKFGDNEYVGVNQKVITDAINKLWEKIEDMNGEHLTGIRMTVTPEYFISELGADVTINANTVTVNGVFEHIAFYANDVLITEEDNVDYLSYNYHISDTTVIKCVATIRGITYEQEKTIVKYNELFIGAGTSYEDVMDEYHTVSIKNGIRNNVDVTCEEEDNIFVVVGKNLSGYIRIDMNGFEIPTTKENVTIDGTEYEVYTSVNQYHEGTYNIDING